MCNRCYQHGLETARFIVGAQEYDAYPVHVALCKPCLLLTAPRSFVKPEVPGFGLLSE